MHSGYAHQVEHVNFVSKKKNTTKEYKVTCEGIEPQFFIELCPM